ncbi:YczE/YyaS/YitT family protein [Halalkalibacter krulwichiae]|uniref:BCR, YitT family n=1 Tax=Halalkalibacter krulwichiae TaxID=199441 RepID=A0A1X9MG04_9BACI|nr:YitT family protein [Halalkalibacter krulwichiae]ARK32378.1 hypothetical protein BkAM31D_22350 [Halalkalibacter krulwichiae]
MRRRISVYLIGLAVAALGIALVIKSGAGTGPWDTVAVGLHLHLGLTIGTWAILSQGLLIFVTSIIERKGPQFLSLVVLVVRSLFLDFWLYLVLRNVDFTSSIGMQWLTFTIGLLLLGTGIGIYLLSKFAASPVDGLMVAIHQRFGLSFTVSRIIIEATAVCLGFLLGGPVGLGTIIMALTLGRIVQSSYSLFQKLSNKEQQSLSA